MSAALHLERAHLHELLRLVRRNPLALHAPTPGQLPFHESDAVARLLRGPNQGGKTTAGAAELHWWGTDTHPYRDVDRRARYGRVTCYSYPQSIKVQRKVWELMPHASLHPDCSYHEKRGFKHNWIKYKHTGREVEFMTTKGGTMAAASESLDLNWFDEPPDEKAYGEGMARMVARPWAYSVFTMTPIGMPVKYLRAKVDEGEIEDFQFSLTLRDCPFLTQEQIDRAYRACLASERPQRIYGEWEGVTPDRLFSAWSDDLLFDGVDDVPGYEVGIGLSWDHGEDAGREYCVLYAYDQQRRKAWLIDERVSKGRTTTQADALAVVEMLDAHGLSLAAVDRAHGDTNSAGKSALISVNRLLEESLAEAVGASRRMPPLRISPARKGPGSVMYGCRVLNQAMAEGRLRVSRNCERFIESVRHWRGTKRGDDEELSHALDANRYGLVALLDPRTKGDTALRLR